MPVNFQHFVKIFSWCPGNVHVAHHCPKLTLKYALNHDIVQVFENCFLCDKKIKSLVLLTQNSGLSLFDYSSIKLPHVPF